LDVVADACSSRGTTVAQMKELLSFATREDHTLLFAEPSLIQMMRAAGYKTFWLSNQQVVGEWDTWSTVFAKPSDVKVFTDRRGGFEGISDDGRLLPLLREALDDPAPKKFIVLHLIGTHTAYDLRYPTSFSRFDDAPVPPGVIMRYNHYDNAVLYQDHLLAEMIGMLDASGRSTLTFLSDHGEALGEDEGVVGHADGPMPRQVYEVPVVFRLSGPQKAALGPKMESFRANLAKPFQTDWLIHTLMQLYGIEHVRWEPRLSLFEERYAPRPRYCDDMKPAEPPKLWLSRN
jgi:heptose-I-phosphate ethanolaminephosphotransferase